MMVRLPRFVVLRVRPLHFFLLAALACPGGASFSAAEPAGEPSGITLERIMADPDWIGNSPEAPYWADDGRSLYFSQKRPGEEARDLVEVDLEGQIRRTVALADLGTADAPGGVYSPDRSLKAYVRAGDLFVKDLATGRLRQLTRTAAEESSPAFLTDGRRVSFQRDQAIFVRDLESGLEAQVAELRLEKDPAVEEPPKGYLAESAPRLSEFLRKEKEKKQAARGREMSERREDSTRLPPAFYLGEGVEIRQLALSPTGDWLVVVLGKKEENRGKKSMMAAFVTASGYVEPKEVRPKVGTGEPATERVMLLDLASHQQHELALSALPGISEDPLAELRRLAKEREKRLKEAGPGALEQEDLPLGKQPGGGGVPDGPEEPPPVVEEAPPANPEAESQPTAEAKKPEPRPVRFDPPKWSDDGRYLVVMAYSADNKDRWIARVDLEGKALVPLHRLHDEAWINWDFNEMGFLHGHDELYFLSEESGYSQLCLISLAETGASPRRLTEGEFTVSAVQPSRDGGTLYYLASATNPGIVEVYRVPVASGASEQVTSLGGQNSFELSPNESKLLLLHSEALAPPELYVQANQPGAEAVRLTRTASAAFTSLPWRPPHYLAVPSSHGVPPIYVRLYLPPEKDGWSLEPGSALPAEEARRYPTIFFIHGAGYLQNAHQGWSSYFHEFFFHSFLVEHGYVVVDLDYRGSAGYGRAWRTAIYRQMGTPELEDLEDVAAYLEERGLADRTRLGVYGGSYGGFMTLMALFKRPELFAAGAALRPVTDWAHYNHDYTSNILNTPDLDPEAYQKSSPIEFADGLARPLLICAPMQDDNVFFQDTVRLAQRLIELGKQDWEVAIFPVEPHGFRQPSSWLDEYRRIFKLFERYVKR